MSEWVTSYIHGRIGVITINRPSALNALNEEIIDSIYEFVESFEASEDISCIVITGNEKAFAAGADIEYMMNFDYMDVYKSDFISRNWERIKCARKPVIAAVRGFALGGGCELAMMCDMIFAAENAKFGQPEVRLGTMPGAGGTQRLPRAIGKYKAMDLCLSARLIDVQEAEKIGLVSRIFPSEELLDQTMKVAEGIASYSLPVLMMIKESVNRAFESSLNEGLIFERRLFHSTFSLKDQKEGMSAFTEKRHPVFNNK